MVLKVCEVCGNSFNQNHKNQKYCGDNCKKEHYRRNHKIYMREWRQKERVKEYEKNYKNGYRASYHGRWKHRQYMRKYRERDYVQKQEKEYSLRILKETPEATPGKRMRWAYMMKIEETLTSKYSYVNDTHQTHHILPVKLYPHFIFEDWNGAVMPTKWHREFHSKTDIQDFCLDWSGLLFDFIDFKIKESNRDLVTLDQWISIEA